MEDKEARERIDSPIVSLLRGNQITKGEKLGIIAGIVLTIGAVAAFIWMLVRASKGGETGAILMMASFILFAVGFLYFFLARINNPKRAWTFLYVSIPIAVAAFVISLFL